MTPAFSQRLPASSDREKWRAEIAAIPPATHQLGRLVLFLFRVGGERFGIEPTHLDLTAPLPALHSMPHRSASLAGVVNVRGAVTLCFSLAKLLGCAPGPVSPRPMLLVLTLGAWRVACQVDVAEGVAEFERAALMPVPATMDAAGRAHVKGIFPCRTGQDIAWLDAESLFKAFDGVAR
ncbi:MAG: chemotaxis protein CheW [Verrucomicrobia bacterium]|nr:chemotaxis protein CheW [Verrucomicrobiota bacterium]